MVKRNWAVALIVNDKNEILLQKKSSDYTYPGFWAFFGGGIDKLETPELALKKELKEEINLDIQQKELNLFKSTDYKWDNLSGKGYYFLIKFRGNLNSLRLSEGAGFAFFNKEEIKKLKLFPHDAKVLEEFFNKKVKNEI